MAVRDALRRVAKRLHADVDEEADRLAFEITVARRKTPGALLQLRYRVTMDVDEGARQVLFSETLWETGLDAKGGMDLTSRFGMKEEAFRVGPPAESGTSIEQQMHLFEKRYAHSFDFTEVRRALAEACKDEGYSLRHLIPL